MRLDAVLLFGSDVPLSYFMRYAVEPARLDEALLVESCVARFAVGELDPTRRLSVSRNGLPGCPPSLAEKLGKRFDKAEPETRVAVGDAVQKALTIGYVAMCEFDGQSEDLSFFDRRPAEDVRDFWAPSCRERIDDVGFPPKVAKGMRSAGADSLNTSLKTLGLSRGFGGSKLNQLGMFYAEAGVLLRIGQTDRVPQSELDAVVTRVRADQSRPWKYSVYEVALN